MKTWRGSAAELDGWRALKRNYIYTRIHKFKFHQSGERI